MQGAGSGSGTESLDDDNDQAGTGVLVAHRDGALGVLQNVRDALEESATKHWIRHFRYVMRFVEAGGRRFRAVPVDSADLISKNFNCGHFSPRLGDGTTINTIDIFLTAVKFTDRCTSNM